MRNEKTVEELLAGYASYQQGAAAIEAKVAAGKLRPVRASGTNGKQPPLFRRYRLPVSRPQSAFDGPALAGIFPLYFSPAWYLAHPAQFEKDAPAIEKLIAFLETDPDLSQPAALNERSFQIFQDEKFLAQSGSRILRNLGADSRLLNTYETYEPLSYFWQKSEPARILVLENLDPFVTCRRLLAAAQQPGILVYGAGKKLIRNLIELQESDIAFLQESLEQLYYLGDLDWEGIRIYETLCAHYPKLKLNLCTAGYLCLLEKGEELGTERLPQMRSGQHPCPEANFFQAFTPDQRERMLAILDAGRYVPQEIMIAADYERILFYAA